MAGTDPSGTIAVDQPTYQREGNPRLVSVDARATSQDFGGGQGLNELARGLDTVSSAAQEVSDKRDALYAQQVATKAEVDWRQNMAKAEQAFTLDPSQGVNYADKFKQQFNDYQQQTLDNNPDITQNAKNLIQTHLNSLGASMFGNALSLQAKASTDWSVQSFQNSATNLSTVVNLLGASVKIDPNTGGVISSFDDARSQHVQLLKTAQGVVPDAMRREENLRFNIKTDKAEIDTSASQNGAGATAKLISDGKLGTSLTIPQRQSQILELQRRETENTTEAIRSYHESANGYSLQVQATGQRDLGMEQKLTAMATNAYGSFGPSYAAKASRIASTDEDKFDAQKQLDQIQSQIINKYPTKESKDNFLKSLQDPNHTITPEEQSDSYYLNYLPAIKANEDPRNALAQVNQFKAALQQNIQDSVKVNQIMGQAKGASVDDLRDNLEQIGDNPQTNVEKSLKPMLAARIKAINQDAFTVTLQDDKPMQNYLSQAASISQGKNPVATALIGETSNDRVNSLNQAAIDRSIALQHQINPNGNLMVMSRGDADNYISQLNGTKSNKDFSGVIAGMQAKFGDHFNEAISQLHNNKNNPLPSGLGLAIGNINEPNAKDIFTAQIIPDGKGQGKEKEKEDNPGYTRLFEDRGKADDEKSIDTAISLDPILSKYSTASGAVSNSKDTLDLVNGTKNSVGKYAKFLYLNPPPGQKYTPDQAVDAAVNSTISKHVDFGDTNGVSYLINKEGKNGTYNSEQVTQIKNQLDNELKNISSKFPAGDVLDQRTELGDLNTPGQHASMHDIQDRAYWVTKSDQSGVSLFLKPEEGESVSRTGIPVPNSFRSFDDLVNKAALPTRTFSLMPKMSDSMKMGLLNMPGIQ